MPHQFENHFTLAQARQLLPRVRIWLDQLRQARAKLEKHEASLAPLLESGADVGGQEVNAWVKTLAEMQETLWQFYSRDIQIKDFERGLLDFPSLKEGKEVFLCWEESEDDIGFWHDLDSGYTGREPLE